MKHIMDRFERIMLVFHSMIFKQDFWKIFKNFLCAFLFSYSFFNFLWYVTIFIKFTKIINKNQRNICGIGRIPFLIRIFVFAFLALFFLSSVLLCCRILFWFLFIWVEWMVILDKRIYLYIFSYLERFPKETMTWI